MHPSTAGSESRGRNYDVGSSLGAESSRYKEVKYLRLYNRRIWLSDRASDRGYTRRYAHERKLTAPIEVLARRCASLCVELDCCARCSSRQTVHRTLRPNFIVSPVSSRRCAPPPLDGGQGRASDCPPPKGGGQSDMPAASCESRWPPLMVRLPLLIRN